MSSVHRFLSYQVSNLDCDELITEFEKEHSSRGASAVNEPPKKKRSQKKQNNGLDSSELIGFERGFEAEEIIGATDLDGQIMFNIKWKGADILDWVPSKEANVKCPQVVEVVCSGFHLNGAVNGSFSLI